LSVILLFQVVSFGGIQNANADSVEIPKWIRTMVKFYADGDTSDKEFASALEHLIKLGIIKSPRLSIVEDRQSVDKDMSVEEKVVVPDWIKNNAKLYADGVIDDSTFISGIEFMIEEEIIRSPVIKVKEKVFVSQELADYTADQTKRPGPELEDVNETAIALFLDKILVDSSSNVIYTGPLESGTIIREYVRSEDLDQIQIPFSDGIYYAFFIDDLPGAKFEHPMRYVLMDVESEKFDLIHAEWPPTIINSEIATTQISDKPVYLANLNTELVLSDIVPKTRSSADVSPLDPSAVRYVASGDLGTGLLHSIAHKSIAVPPTGTVQCTINGEKTKQALVIDLGDIDRGYWPESIAGTAGLMASDADSIAKYLKDNGYEVKRISQYWGNSHDMIVNRIEGDRTEDMREGLVSILQGYSKMFQCTNAGGQCCEFFLYIVGHADKFGILTIFDPIGSGDNESILPAHISMELKKFPQCVKLISFIDACYSGKIINSMWKDLKNHCPPGGCGVTLMSSTDSDSSSSSGTVWDSGTEDFMQGASYDYDLDGNVGDLEDRFRHMESESSYGPFGTPQELRCSPNQPFCSLDKDPPYVLVGEDVGMPAGDDTTGEGTIGADTTGDDTTGDDTTGDDTTGDDTTGDDTTGDDTTGDDTSVEDGELGPPGDEGPPGDTTGDDTVGPDYDDESPEDDFDFGPANSLALTMKYLVSEAVKGVSWYESFTLTNLGPPAEFSIFTYVKDGDIAIPIDPNPQTYQLSTNQEVTKAGLFKCVTDEKKSTEYGLNVYQIDSSGSSLIPAKVYWKILCNPNNESVGIGADTTGDDTADVDIADVDTAGDDASVEGEDDFITDDEEDVALGLEDLEGDFDEDGVINALDKCPYEPGPKSNNGCPEDFWDDLPEPEDVWGEPDELLVDESDGMSAGTDTTGTDTTGTDTTGTDTTGTDTTGTDTTGTDTTGADTDNIDVVITTDESESPDTKIDYTGFFSLPAPCLAYEWYTENGIDYKVGDDCSDVSDPVNNKFVMTRTWITFTNYEYRSNPCDPYSIYEYPDGTIAYEYNRLLCSSNQYDGKIVFPDKTTIDVWSYSDKWGYYDATGQVPKSGAFGGITSETEYVNTDALLMMNSNPTTSTIGKQGYSYGFKAVPTFNTEINSDKVCGLSLCSEKLTIEQKIEYYLLARGLN